MKPSRLVLRCYAECEPDGVWFAICLDLNLYARADTFRDAKHSLHCLIADYVREVVTGDPEYADGLLNRPAPLYFWVRYFWVWFKGRLHQATAQRKFKLPMPLVPA